jgi:hypothetical protein
MGRISQRSKRRAEKEFNIYFNSMERETNIDKCVNFAYWLLSVQRYKDPEFMDKEELYEMYYMYLDYISSNGY